MHIIETNFPNLESLIVHHQELRPLLTFQDVYKLLYQGVFGIGHIIINPSNARNYLEQELLSMASEPLDEPLSEPVAINGSMIRINLRPVMSNGMNTETLFHVMIESALRTTGSIAEFTKLWETFVELVQKRRLIFKKSQLAAFHRDVQKAAYPVMHHSPIYRKHYHPAYRVVLASVFKQHYSLLE